MIKILFICHGNICRSPMGEFMLKDMVKKAALMGEFEIASAAVTGEEIGNPVYPPVRRELAKHGIDCSGKRARQVTAADLEYYDRIYYMDDSNWNWLCWHFDEDKLGKCRKLLPRDVADPWYTDDFEATWEDLTEGCEMILKELSVC